MSVNLNISGADPEDAKKITNTLITTFSQYSSTEFVTSGADYTISGMVMGYTPAATMCRVNIKLTDKSGETVATFGGAISAADLTSEGFASKLLTRFEDQMPKTKFSSTPKTKDQWIALLEPPKPAPKPEPEAPKTAATEAVASASTSTPKTTTSSSASTNTTTAKTANTTPAPAKTTTTTPAPAKTAAAPASAKSSVNTVAGMPKGSASDYLSKASAEESKGNYVDALILYCDAGIVDPWNKTAIDKIKKLADKLSSGSYGNKSYGCSATDPYDIQKTWIKLELEYLRFLSSTCRYKLTYSPKIEQIQQDSTDIQLKVIRYKVNFKFEEDLPGYKDMKRAFETLRKSDYALAAAIQEFTVNNEKQEPELSDIKNVPTAAILGTRANEPGYEVGGSSKGSVKSIIKQYGSIVKEAAGITTHIYEEVSTITYKSVPGYYYKWVPCIQIAIADKNGNPLNDWTWWIHGDSIELCVPYDKAGYADHLIVSNQWRMAKKTAILYSDLNLYYTPRAEQLIIKK